MVIAPIKELKDGAAISAKCHELDDIADDFRTSMAEYRAGKSRDAFEALAELREKHGL